MRHYGKKLAALMKWKGVSKAETARETGIPLSTLKLSLGDPEPNTGVVVKVLCYLRLPMDAVFSERDITPLESEIMQVVQDLPAAKQKALLDLMRKS